MGNYRIYCIQRMFTYLNSNLLSFEYLINGKHNLLQVCNLEPFFASFQLAMNLLEEAR
jgi:hypothetical protein